MSPPRDWGALARRLRRAVQVDLLTVLQVDWQSSLVRRSYSSNERRYPSGGVKQLMASSWASRVIIEQCVFVSTDDEAFAEAFSDHELLHEMGLRFALNVPIVEGGKTSATVNLLRGASAYDALAVAAVRGEIDALMS
jgi:hypothetical protein